MWSIDNNTNTIHKSDMAGPGDFAFEPSESSDYNKARGVWSDGSTLWVVNAARATVVSHRISDYRRKTTFNVDGDGDSPQVHGICASGSVMWVADSRDDKLYAYNLPGGSRNSGKDITLHGDNGHPRGLHCDATHIWVADDSGGADKIFAYNHSTKARVTGQEFPYLWTARNNSPRGIWSDGTTMWVVDAVDRKVYAYAHSSKQRDITRDLHRLRATQLEGHLDWSGGTDQDSVLYQAAPLPYGLWSDGKFMWVSDENHNRVYHNENPKRSVNANLRFITVADPSGKWAVFGPDVVTLPDYSFHTAPGQSVVTVNGQTVDDGGWVTYHDADAGNALLTDADADTTGFQFSVYHVSNGITVRGHARNGKRTRDHALAISRDPVSEKRLSGLTLTNIDLDPAFSGDTTDYEDPAVGVLVTETVVTPTARHYGATITVNGASVASGFQYTVPLSPGENTITIVVTAEDESTRTYTVTANRSHGPAISIAGGAAVIEGSDISFTLDIETAVPAVLAVNVAISGDYGLLLADGLLGQQSHSITVPVPPNMTSHSFAVPTVADQTWEEHGNIRATVTDGENYQPASSGASATVRVEDDDVPDSTILLTVASTMLNEGQSLMATVTMTTYREEAPTANRPLGSPPETGPPPVRETSMQL